MCGHPGFELGKQAVEVADLAVIMRLFAAREDARCYGLSIGQSVDLPVELTEGHKVVVCPGHCHYGLSDAIGEASGVEVFHSFKKSVSGVCA